MLQCIPIDALSTRLRTQRELARRRGLLRGRLGVEELLLALARVGDRRDRRLRFRGRGRRGRGLSDPALLEDLVDDVNLYRNLNP